MTDCEQELMDRYFGEGAMADFAEYTYDNDMNGRLESMQGPACKIGYLKAVCAELSHAPRVTRRWMCQVRLGEDSWKWVVAFGPPGTQMVGSDLHKIGAALRCLLDQGGDMDETASTLLLLPPLDLIWHRDAATMYGRSTKAFGMEMFTRGAANAWLKCGGEVALHDMRGVIYG